ncbi:hypothetical protein L3X38_004729 [Prunus dulcis]|uniref:Uncharacterized protein n=1 Tax=Prunus dulcis TaxID=3755 RepID=A0AAD4ZPI1_PRUDU|nr:hypothetical protein L3X38_004729 [Prunus dulcis]
MADSSQYPALAWLGLVGKGRRASGGSIGTGAGDQFAGWRLLGLLEGEENSDSGILRVYGLVSPCSTQQLKRNSQILF